MAHEIVAIESESECAGRQLVTVDLANRARNTSCDWYTARANADQSQFFDSAVALDDFVRNAHESPLHAFRAHHDRHGTPHGNNERSWDSSVKIEKAERTETLAIAPSSRPH